MKRFVMSIVLCAMLVAVPGQAAVATESIAATGSFAFAGLVVQDVQPVGRACLIRGDITFLFTQGTLEGVASGPVTVISFAPCDAPIGSAGDHFDARLGFDGTIAGEAATTSIHLTGATRPGGEIDGVMVVHGGGYSGALAVDAVAFQGGTYAGRLAHVPGP